LKKLPKIKIKTGYEKGNLTMREISTALLIMITVFLTAACATHSNPPESKPPESQTLDQMLAERNYRIGEEVESISDIRMDERIYVDPKNLLIPAEGDRYYLVALREPCFGLQTQKIVLRSGTYKELKKFDRIATMYRGRSAATCWIKAIFQLEKQQENWLAGRP
jgi:hypothetical protein